MTLFLENELKQAEEDYSKVSLKKEQREVIVGLSKIICSQIETNELAIRGFMMRAIAQMQKEHQILVSEASSWSVEERKKNLLQLFDIVKNNLLKILRNSEEKPKIEKAFAEAYNVYINIYANRKK